MGDDMIKLAIFDLDGTLLRRDKTLSKITIEAVKALKRSGVTVAVATGRNYEMVSPYLRRLGLYEGPVVTCNGAIIHELSDKRILASHAIGKEAQARMIDFAASHQYPFVIFNTTGAHTLQNERIAVYEAWNEKHPKDRVDIHIHDGVESLKAIEANKILTAIEDKTKTEEASKLIAPLDQATSFQSNEGLLDVVAPLGTKGEGARFLMDHYNVAPEETVAFGDNDNDAQMLERIPLSFALKNATIRAKRAASHITALENDRDGVADTLYKHILKN